MGFSVSGDVGGQAVSALEALLTRQLEEAQAAEAKRANKAREAQASERLAFDKERFTADQDARQQDIEQESIDGLRKNNDRIDARLTRLQGEEDQMDKDAAIQKILEALTPQQRAIQQLGGKLSMDDLKTPEQVKAEADARVEQVRREAEARAAAEAKYRPAPAAKSAGAATTPSGGDKTAAEVVRIATALKNHPSRKNVFGVLDSKLPTMRQGTADAETLFNSLKAMLTLENTDKMKGVLSDSDMRLLQQASSSLSGNMSDPAAEAELTRLIEVMSRANGGGAPTPSVSHEPTPTAESPYEAYLRRRGRK